MENYILKQWFFNLLMMIKNGIQKILVMEKQSVNLKNKV